MAEQEVSPETGGSDPAMVDFLRRPRWWGVPVVTGVNLLRTLKIFLTFAILSLGVGVVVALLGGGRDLPKMTAAWNSAVSLFLLLSFIFIWFIEAFFCFRCLANSYGMFRYRTTPYFDARMQWLWNPFSLYSSKHYAPEGIKHLRLVLDGMLGATLAALPILIAVLTMIALGMDF
jgi:hypothetical protein